METTPPNALHPIYQALLNRTEADRRTEPLVLVAKEVAKTLAARRRKNDSDAWIPLEDFTLLRDSGLLKLGVPTELGGHGLWQGQAFLPHFRILEALAYGDPSVSQCIQTHSGATYLITTLTNAEQKRRFAREFIEDGKLVASIGSEAPLSTKGPAAYKSELKRVAGGWILDGAKSFSTFGPTADYFLTWTLVPGSEPAEERMSLALVPRISDSVKLVNDWDTLGMRATMSWTIHFDQHFVPDDMMIGRPGWWIYDMPRVSYLLGPCSNYLGAAQCALDFTVKYVSERPLYQTQFARIKLGELSAELEAARLAVYACARLWEDEKVTPDSAEYNTMTALHLSRTAAVRVTGACFDICGARSTYNIYPLGNALRDGRTYTLQHRGESYLEMIGRTLLGETFSKRGEAELAVKQG